MKFHQAQILAQDDTYDASTAADMQDEDVNNRTNNKLRKMLSEILVDNINLRRQVSLLLHRALKTGIITATDMAVPSENSLENKLDTR